MFIVTGAAGFIGSALVGALNAAGHKDIWAVDNLGSGDKWKNLNGKTFSKYLNKHQFRELLKGSWAPASVEAIFHMGACSSTLETNVDYLMDNNFQYSVDVASFCLKRAVPLVYASSAATYGDGANGFSDRHDINLLKPLNPYGFSKQAFDLWLLHNGLVDKFVGIKFFNVFGPNEYHKGTMRSMVHKGYQQIKGEGKIRLFKSNTPKYADGGQLRDFIYVKDCTAAMLWMLRNPQVKGLYNLGAGKARSWNDLSTAIFSALNLPVNIEYIEMPEQLSRQYQNFTEAPMQKLREAGYQAEFTSLENAVHDYVKNYLESQDPYL